MDWLRKVELVPLRRLFRYIAYNRQLRAIGLFFHALYTGIDNNDCIGQATKISYTMLFSLIPILIITIRILTFLGLDADSINKILSLGTEALPTAIHDLISEFIHQILTTPPTGLFGVSIVIILWSSTTVFSEIIYGLNRIANTEEFRSFWKRRILAFLLVLGVGISSGISLTFLMVGRKTLQFFQLPDIQLLSIFKYRWPISTFLLMFAAILLYTIAPANRPRITHTLPGAIFFTTCVTFLTILVQRGVIKFVFTNALYGTLGSGLLLMTWFFMVSLALLVGAEISAILERWKLINSKVTEHRIPSKDTSLVN